MSEINTRSTSRRTAQASDVVLRQTDQVRLVFRPTILDNSSNEDASVKGVFLYQKKQKFGRWEDFETIPLTSVKSGEGFKLELKSKELLKLVGEVDSLYQLKRDEGVPRGQKRYIQVTPQLDQLRAIESLDLRILNANMKLGGSLLSKLLAWWISLDDPSTLIEKLLELDPSSLSKLNAALGLGRLKSALQIWDQNKDNSDEEVWQASLTEHSFVLEQVFSWPASIVEGKAYVGGKNVFNKSGNIVDFLVKKRLTQSAALIEIKTPTTKLLGSKYRQTFNVSAELSGSTMQILNYKHSLQEAYRDLRGDQKDLFDSFDPQCAVIIGSTDQLDDRAKVKAFELYRHQFPGLAIIPFDELFERTRKLVGLLEAEPGSEPPG
ncbi:MAG: Shedu immune nuclease family protein [Gammaproteobacteria bacterium]|nr:Shedu immune nuclease family protein [Gammaproteobacteria bacterium]